MRMDDKDISFLGSILPFNQINENALLDLSRRLGRETFPPQALIIEQQSPGISFYIIKSGLVKVFLVDEKGQEKVLGFLGEGDCFGEISLLTDGLTTANILTVEETVCYIQPKEDFLRMVRCHPFFLEFFNRLLTQRMLSIYKEILIETPGISQVEPFLFSKKIKEMISARDYCLGPGSGLRQAAEKIVREDLEALIVLDDRKKIVGILDRKDVIEAFLHEGREPEVSVELFAKKNFRTVDSESFFFDALHEMVKGKTPFLVVRKGE
jgi:CBS domain-containing protein